MVAWVGGRQKRAPPIPRRGCEHPGKGIRKGVQISYTVTPHSKVHWCLKKEPENENWGSGILFHSHTFIFVLYPFLNDITCLFQITECSGERIYILNGGGEREEAGDVPRPLETHSGRHWEWILCLRCTTMAPTLGRCLPGLLAPCMRRTRIWCTKGGHFFKSCSAGRKRAQILMCLPPLLMGYWLFPPGWLERGLFALPRSSVRMTTSSLGALLHKRQLRPPTRISHGQSIWPRHYLMCQ